MKLPPLVVRAQAEAIRLGFDPALPDPRRDAWLEHSAFSATELWVTPERRAIIAVRRG